MGEIEIVDEAEQVEEERIAADTGEELVSAALRDDRLAPKRGGCSGDDHGATVVELGRQGSRG